MNEIMGLNTFDIVVIALILLLSIKGLLNGFTKELFGAIGLIGGIFVASYFQNSVAEYIYSNITDAVSLKLLKLLSLVAIFLLFWFIVSAIGKGIATIGGDDYISATSRLGGMLVKVVKLFFIFSLIIYAFSTKPQVTKDFKNILESSKLFPLLKNTGATILNMPILSSVNIKQDVNSTNTLKDDNKTQQIVETNSTKTDKAVEPKEVIENNNTDSSIIKLEENSSVQENNTTDINSTQH